MRNWLFLILLMIYVPVGAVDLPDIGLSADMLMSPTEEQKLGEAFMRQLRRQAEVIDDEQIHSYINNLGNRLASYSDNPAQNFHFFVIKEPAINAFAVPGGFIGVHSGLILATRDEGELASVLAHEIAHVTQRHIARTVEASQRLSLPAMAALIAAVVAGAKNPEIGEAAATAVMAGNVQMQIHFTRAHEKEADRVGIQILAKTGFDPYSMPTFFERLLTATRYFANGIPEFLRTHPITTDRIAEARERAEKYAKKLPEDAISYHLMRAKLVVLAQEKSKDLVNELREMLQEGRYRDERATRYALALAALENRQIQETATQVDWLLKQDSDKLVYRLLQARLALLQEKTTQAFTLYEQTLQIYPDNLLLILEYAEKLLQYHKAERAEAVLSTLSTPSNPDYYRLLAKTYQLTHKPAEAQLALAEQYYLMGQTGLAVEQLKQARKQAHLDFYTAARIEARYKVLQEALYEEQMAEKRD